MKEKLKRFILSEKTDKWLIAFNFVALGWGVVNSALHHNIAGVGGYFVALMWCVLFYQANSHIRELRKILDGAMEGWGKCVDFLNNLEEEARKAQEDNKQP